MIPPLQTRPCCLCGEPVTHAEATMDRHGWWHERCEQAAWEKSGLGARPVEAPFGRSDEVIAASLK